MSPTKLRISLDYHGVIDRDFAFWRRFSCLAHHQGHQIAVVSGGPAVEIRDQLKYQRIVYDYLWCVLDYCLATGKAAMLPTGEFRIRDDDWNQAKAFLCTQSQISLHVDDSPSYARWFTLPYCLCRPSSRTCLDQNGRLLSFSSPSELLCQIEQMF